MKTKTIILVFLCIIISAIIGLFLWALFKHCSETENISYMPEIIALTLEGEEININEQLDPRKKTAVVFFHPECEFCQEEINGIIKRYSECQNVQWVFLTLALPEEITSFLAEYPILTIPDAFLIRENWPNVSRRLNFTAPPEMLVYDKNGKLINKHKGATSIRTIVEELQ